MKSRLPYPKRLIEVDLPIKRISTHARREKSIRHGHIATLHIWWARRPLAACRAVICAALWPDPADPKCPQAFIKEARDQMLAWTPHERQKLLSAESQKRFEKARKKPTVFDDAGELRSALLDFIADFAGKLPMDVISELVGVPPVDRAEVRRLADLVVHREDGLFDVPRAGMDAALTLVGYYQDMVNERRSVRRDDLASALLDAEIDGDKLTDEEIIAFLFLMVVAGNETTTKLLGNAWYWGWRNPDQGTKPFDDPARVVDWIEETLRFDTSSQMLLRVTRMPLELHDTAIPEGAKVLLLIGSGNRDESVFPDPERYDLDRDTTKLISFGNGRHFCMGAPLARLEARIGLGELVKRVASYEVDPSGMARVHSINVRGFATLPTKVTIR